MRKYFMFIAATLLVLSPAFSGTLLKTYEETVSGCWSYIDACIPASQRLEQIASVYCGAQRPIRVTEISQVTDFHIEAGGLCKSTCEVSAEFTCEL